MICTVSRRIWTTCRLVAGSCLEAFSCIHRHSGLVSFVCNLLIRGVTDPHTGLTSLTLSPLRSSSVHVHVLLHGLNLHLWNLLDDFPVLDHGNLHDVVTPSHQSSQQAATGAVIAFVLAVSHSLQPPG